MTELNDGVTLEEAKQAYLAMQDLQQKAALYPKLKHEAEKREAQARLEQLKEQCIEDFQDNIEGYEQLKADFQKLYNDAQDAVSRAALKLREYRNKGRQLAGIADSYAQQAWRFDLEFNNADAYKTGNVSVMQYRAEVAKQKINEHPIDNADFNDLYEVIRNNV
jgi:uncharacterized membrane-anchored protein YhcB (DUF1043 family)